MKFLIADDHVLVRKGLVELLAAEYPHCRFVEADNVPDSIECILHCELDLVVLDVSMPGGTGLDVLAAASAAKPELPVLVVSVHPEDQYGPRAVRAGASGFLNKDAAPAKLAEAVRTVLAGGKYISAVLSSIIAAEPVTMRAHPPDDSQGPATPISAPAKATPAPGDGQVPLAPRNRTGT